MRRACSGANRNSPLAAIPMCVLWKGTQRLRLELCENMEAAADGRRERKIEADHTARVACSMDKLSPLIETAPDANRLYLVLDRDFRILRASAEYLHATLLWREEIGSRNIFDVFPDNPHNPTADGVRNLKASLCEAVRSRRPHRMPEQRYDVRDHVTGQGWVEKHWLAVNSPVLFQESTEVSHIVHEVQDVTKVVHLRRWVQEQAFLIEEKRATLDQMLQDLTDQQKIFGAARSLLQFERRQVPPPELVEELRSSLGGPETRLYFRPGQSVPVSGIYSVFHIGNCSLVPSQIYAVAGTKLHACLRCKESTYYRLFNRT
jgi:hypothetical protein